MPVEVKAAAEGLNALRTLLGFFATLATWIYGVFGSRYLDSDRLLRDFRVKVGEVVIEEPEPRIALRLDIENLAPFPVEIMSVEVVVQLADGRHVTAFEIGPKGEIGYSMLKRTGLTASVTTSRDLSREQAERVVAASTLEPGAGARRAKVKVRLYRMLRSVCGYDHDTEGLAFTTEAVVVAKG